MKRIAGLETRTVHGVIGEADLAIIITGRTDGPQTPKNWVFQIPTGNLSISRGKQLLIVIGDFDHIHHPNAGTLEKLITFYSKRCQVVNGYRYEKLLAASTPGMTHAYRTEPTKNARLLGDQEGSYLVAKVAINTEARWINEGL